MPGETVYLPCDEEYPQRTAAAFLSVVAYPDNQKRRRRFELAAGSLVLRRRAETDSEWAWSPQMVTPGVLLLDPIKSERELTHCLGVLITRRLPAAGMARVLLADEGLRQFDPEKLGTSIAKALSKPYSRVELKVKVPIEEFDPKTEHEITKHYDPSVRSLAEHTAQMLNKASPGWAMRDARGWTRENVITRLWVPAKPVLHLALALYGVIDEKFAGRTVNILELLDDEWVSNAVHWSECMRLSIGENPRFRIEDSETVQVQFELDKEAVSPDAPRH